MEAAGEAGTPRDGTPRKGVCVMGRKNGGFTLIELLVVIAI
ncbi:MAG: type II secretion system protein, partial [Candidatus Hydrogenedens sp.]|nr:type II secretion system protein [Candidatus Hydrogenedens sp.]